jgi:hypothetical protein
MSQDKNKAKKEAMRKAKALKSKMEKKAKGYK